MTTPDLERRIRTWYADEIGEAEAAPSFVRTFLATIPQSMPQEQGLFGRRPFVLLAAALLLVSLLAGAVAVGSGLLKLPSILPLPDPSLVVESPGPSSPPQELTFDCAAAQASASIRTDRWQAGPAQTGAVRSGWIAAWGVGTTPELVLVNPVSGDICSLTAFHGYGPLSDGRFGGGPLAWSPDGSALAILVGGLNGATELFVWSPVGLAGPILHVESSSLYVPSWSPDGSRLAVGESTGNLAGPFDPASVWIVPGDGTAARTVQADCAACFGGTAYWSPSGNRIAMHTWSEQDASIGGIAVGSVGGSTLTVVSGTSAGDALFGWANEGAVRVLGTDTHLVDVGLDGVERVDHGVTGYGGPLRQSHLIAVSPDGMHAAVIVEELDMTGDLMLCEISSTRCDLVASNIPRYLPVWWSPDGQTIGYLMNVTCGPCPSTPLPAPGIWLIDPDGTGHRRLTNALHISIFSVSTWDTFAPAVWQPRW